MVYISFLVTMLFGLYIYLIFQNTWLCSIPMFLISVVCVWGESYEDKIKKKIEKLEKEVKELKEKNNE